MIHKNIVVAISLLASFAEAQGQTQPAIINRILSKDPGLTVYNRADKDKYIVAAVVDKQTHISYLISSYGQITDSVYVSPEDYLLLEKKQTTPFKHYNAICDKIASLTHIAKSQLRKTGQIDPKWPYARLVSEQISTTKGHSGSLQKIIRLDQFALPYLISKWMINTPDPKYLSENTTRYDTKHNEAKAGTMLKKKDTTIYYNMDDFSAIHKAVLDHNGSKIFYYKRNEEVIDSLNINAQKIPALLKQKTNIFFLYRAWLELQKMNIDEEIKQLQVETGRTAPHKNQFTNTPSATPQLLAAAQKESLAINERINRTETPEDKTMATMLYHSLQGATPNMAVLDALGAGYTSTMQRGNKKYELIDHRGNVLVVVSDRKLGIDDGVYQTVCYPCFPGIVCPPCEYNHIDLNPDGQVDYYVADVVSAADNYSFGMAMPNRTYQPGQYRYSINGQEKSDEINANLTTALFWEYDSRVGRRWNVDPVLKDGESPYSTFSNNPVLRTDPNGDSDSVPKTIYAGLFPNYIHKKAPTTPGFSLTIGTTGGPWGGDKHTTIVSIYGDKTYYNSNPWGVCASGKPKFLPDEPNSFVQMQFRVGGKKSNKQVGITWYKQKFNDNDNGFGYEAPTAIQFSFGFTKKLGQIGDKIELIGNFSFGGGVLVGMPRNSMNEAITFDTKNLFGSKYSVIGTSQSFIARVDAKIVKHFALFVAGSITNMQTNDQKPSTGILKGESIGSFGLMAGINFNLARRKK
jgi:hypothetical protein